MKPAAAVIIDFHEYEEQRLPIRQLPRSDGDAAIRFVEEVKDLVDVRVDPRSEEIVLKAGSKVGVVTSSGIRVQVRPRLSASEFCTLVLYAIDGKVALFENRALAALSWAVGFEDVLALLLSSEIEFILSSGISRRYEELREPMNALRGRPLWERNFPWRRGLAREVICRHHQLTYDNIDNRLLLAALLRVSKMARSAGVRQRLTSLVQPFREFATEFQPSPCDFEAAANGYNRLNEHYRNAHEIASMILFGLRSRSPFEAGRRQSHGVVVDMAILFERFVERIMTDLLQPKGMIVKAQPADFSALLDGERRPYASVRPDIEVQRAAGQVLGVLDAKYKMYWSANDENGRPERRITNDDIYQLFFYQQRLQRKSRMTARPAAVIVTPVPAEDERRGKPVIEERYRRIYCRMGSETDGEVRLLLLPMTDFLRMLKSGTKPEEAIRRTIQCPIAEWFV